MKIRKYLSDQELGSSPENFKTLEEVTKEELDSLQVVDSDTENFKPIESEEASEIKAIDEINLEAEKQSKEISEDTKNNDKDLEDENVDDNFFELKEEKSDKKEDDKNVEKNDKNENNNDKQIEEVESTWIDIAKELDIDLQEDDFEKFKEKIKEREEKLIKEAVEKAKESFSSDIKKYSPQAQRLIEFLDNGGTLEDYINPLKVYDELLSMDKEDLIREDLRLKGYSEAQIEEKIIKMDEDGLIDAEYNKLKNIVLSNKEKAEQDLVEKIKNDKLAAEKAKHEQIQKENKIILEHISKLDTFMGKKVPEETKKVLQKRWEEGYYRKRFAENPVDVVNTIMFIEFGEKFKKLLEKEAFDKGVFKALGKLSNVVEKKEYPNQRDIIDSNMKDENNIFSAWEEGLKKFYSQ